VVGIVQWFNFIANMAYAIASWEEEERDCLRAVGMGTWRKA
jgi:hypothetical protein